eukprot:SAG22_NODE_6439_length_855_cov_1.560847_1_plen_97_part_10
MLLPTPSRDQGAAAAAAVTAMPPAATAAAAARKVKVKLAQLDHDIVAITDRPIQLAHRRPGPPTQSKLDNGNALLIARSKPSGSMDMQKVFELAPPV